MARTGTRIVRPVGPRGEAGLTGTRCSPWTGIPGFLWPEATLPSADHPHQGLHYFLVVENAFLPAQFGQGRCCGQGRAVRAVGGHGFVDVGHRQDAGFLIDFIPRKAVRVAGAVQAFVVAKDDVATF